jgi:hypothetical protein
VGFVRQSYQCARDYRKGITIRFVSRFEDLGPGDAWPYHYSQGDLSFEFRVIDYNEWRLWISRISDPSLGMQRVADYVLEPSIRGGLAAAKCSASQERYQELKQDILDGMWCLATQGGYRFRFVPDFRVELAASPDAVPKHRQRPASTDHLKSASFFEDMSALREHRNNSFVFEDRGAHDADRNITIKHIAKFESADDTRTYVYSQDDVTFEFRASQYREFRRMLVQQVEKLLWPLVGTFVIESSIRKGMIEAKCPPLTPEAYQELKRNIRDGIWEAEALGEIKDVPDFRFEFVEGEADVPKSQSHPPDHLREA